MRDGRPAPWQWLAALVAALALLVGVCIVAAWPDDPPPPPPVTAPTEPAPLPPATGVDGEGLAVAPDLAQPDGLPIEGDLEGVEVMPAPGPGSGLVEVVPQPEGIGGEVYVKSPAFRGKQRLNAGRYYPSGRAHWGWDVGIQRGTKLFAARDARVIGRNDGVDNHPPGAQYAIPGSASNWVLLCSRVRGVPTALYYQHMSPGLRVHVGQKVPKGKFIGRSGNTGNSTGDHLHMSSQELRSGQTCGSISASQADRQRYDYLSYPKLRKYAPARFWRPQWTTTGVPKTVGRVAQTRKISAAKFCALNAKRIRDCSAATKIPPGRYRID